MFYRPPISFPRAVTELKFNITAATALLDPKDSNSHLRSATNLQLGNDFYAMKFFSLRTLWTQIDRLPQASFNSQVTRSLTLYGPWYLKSRVERLASNSNC